MKDKNIITTTVAVHIEYEQLINNISSLWYKAKTFTAVNVKLL